ncbi:hypothetical protein [Algoriella sp.]|uniref:hypothetical protein n=1 Tax=Algoriella sp. TaxID=1872434 RepID=UPI002FC9FE82
MTNDYLKDLDDWDEQSQQILLSLAKNDEFISFEELEKGILRKAKNQLNSIKTNQSFQEISNQIALESPFGKNSLIYKPTIEDYDDLNKEFYTDSIDYELLANDLRNNLLKSTNFLFDYQKYKKDSLTISHSNTLGIPIVHEIKDNSSDLYFETGMLNKRKNLLSNRSKYYFGIYSHHDKIIYNLNFIYKDGENINFRKVENKISEELTDYVVNDEYIAIKLYTKNSDVYLKFLETIYGSEDREYMKNKIILYYKDFITNGKNNADILDSLYESIPDFVLEKLSDEELWNDLVTLSTASINRVGTDENVSIINLLGGIKNYTWWYNKINVNANVVQRLLENFSKQYRDQLIQIFSTIGIHNWTNKELEKAWKFDIDYERVEVDYKETIYYTGYAYYIEEKNKYDVGTAIFLYENFSPNRKSEIKDTLGLHSPFDVVKIPLEKNNYLYVPCFVAEY